jgi:hypothetical protein
MCFSANASFAASGVLAAVGAASIRETKTKRGLLYAFIPLIFAIQQFVEGLQWLTRPGAWSVFLAYGFLFFRSYPLAGLRSGFGLFDRNASPQEKAAWLFYRIRGSCLGLFACLS